jgi:hypothetical protein
MDDGGVGLVEIGRGGGGVQQQVGPGRTVAGGPQGGSSGLEGHGAGVLVEGRHGPLALAAADTGDGPDRGPVEAPERDVRGGADES